MADGLLTDRVDAVAARWPTRIAMVDGERRATYAEFWSSAHGFARELRRRGLQPGDRVAIVLQNCIEAAAACYGAWIAGMVSVPLNVQARSRDLAPWLAHCGAALVVHARGHADVAEALAALPSAPPTLEVDAGACPWTPAPPVPAAAAHDAARPAAIVYTSGTTGSPKGVTLSQANLAANVAAVIDYLGLTADDVVLSVLPFYYAYGASVLHTHLASGACIVLEPNMLFPRTVVDSIARHRATGFSGVPSTFALLLERGDLASRDLDSLRYVTQAGGAMSPSLAARVRAAIPRARLFVMYGQTEATSRLTYLPPERLEDKAGSVGRPLRGVRLRVVDEAGRDAAPGVEGDVIVQGPNVMLGYWNAPDETARVLRDGWLHTGDRGHLDGDGFLYLCGRRSDMIKTGAHRVYPTDVEDAIQEVPGVAEVAVVGVDDPVLGQVIKAYVVASRPLERGGDTVKAHCRTRLAPFKVPRHVEFVDSLPRTASGKVRRIELN